MEITQALLSDIVHSALKRGATEAEVIALESNEFSVDIRLGEVETLEESASRGLGLRVIYEGRQASASTSDIQEKSLEKLVADAVEMARYTSVDEAAVLPSREELLRESETDLQLYDEAIAALPTERKIEIAQACEAAARTYDPRITNSEGARCSTTLGKMLLVTSSGFTGEYRGSNCGLMVAPIARDGDQMQLGGWGDRQRWLSKLDSPEEIGNEAARRALDKLGARKIATQEVPIVFDASMAAELLSSLFEAVSGESVFRRASFLVGKLDEMIAAPALTVIDDGCLPGAVGSRPFDGEGLPTRRTAVIENGVLRSYLLNTYTARKLGLRSTANAMRGLTGAPSVGVTNFYIAAGETPPEEIIASVKNGFYVTEQIGFGFNPVTGDYSRGASGRWIENGRLTSAVEEVTIAGNFREILRGIEMIGNDLRFRGNLAAPTLKINKMMVSGD
ncbi:MAG: TldD/PmbA family protein [Acidobacteria bacterium]|nr:TldD/PmbA family protein [Acidobacteriota bacterium]